jgi:L-ribulose-5-phosphate 3-epimerase UlaE
MGYHGIFMVEMWNEDVADPVATVAAARTWLAAKLDAAFATGQGTASDAQR